jgi:hypothetical protein
MPCADRRISKWLRLFTRPPQSAFAFLPDLKNPDLGCACAIKKQRLKVGGHMSERSTPYRNVPQGQSGNSSTSGATPGGERASGLDRIAILSGLSARERMLLAALCRSAHYISDEVIGMALEDVGFVVRGSVQLVTPADASGCFVHHRVEAGQQFGDLAVLGQDLSDTSILACEPTELIICPGTEFLNILSRHTVVSSALLRQYAHALHSLDRA